jgi:hypothetical protein
MDFLPPSKRDFPSLSIRSLLEAREAYHVHLSRMERVIGTAIGRFLIRRQDKDFKNPYGEERRYQPTPRTLENSDVRKWSWPCVLVFVDGWLTKEEMDERPDDVVPRFLYLPDGRIVPTCVVQADVGEEPLRSLERPNFPSKLVGGGYPVMTEAQNSQHVGSLGCLVTDGEAVYALTNQHVIGAAGREALTLVSGQRRTIGKSTHKQIGKKLFSEVYKGYPEVRAFSTLDAALVRLEDVNNCTAQVFGLGELDRLIDANVNTLSLDYIGQHVRAFGGVSGELKGRIFAFFYRYRAMGGFDFVADLLIGPRDGRTPLRTQHGDSGTVWVYDPPPPESNGQGALAPKFRPLGLQWGGQKLLSDGREMGVQFALATFLSTVCRELDVDLITDMNIGQVPYWGRLGHYHIAAKACGLATNPKLAALLDKNVNRLSFDVQTILDSSKSQKTGVFKQFNGFVPLADVPDLVWKSGPAGIRRGKEGPNHFADVDAVSSGPRFPGKSLLDLTRRGGNIDPAVWESFYDELNDNSDTKTEKGLLPFRVWQIYQEMVDFVKERKVADFVCAAGVLAHYVGDACQPLHSSQFHDGPVGQSIGVHSMYENTMLDSRPPEVMSAVDSALGNRKAKKDVAGGKEAAASIIQLFRDVRKILAPEEIVDFFQTLTENKPAQMWEEFGERTAECMALGCLRLASLWQSAWVEGGGDQIPNNKLVEIKTSALRHKYENKAFLESMNLQDMIERQILE